ncbi:MAG: nitroreductase family protein [Lachnospiraceae bacterium]|jgi:nitroreductase|nr:nitroreductase family protein [Lachnospiraceae bacterium]
MNLYEAISLRKSHRNFLMEEIEPETLAEIGAFYEEAPSLFPGIKTEIGITDNTDGKHAPKGFFGVKAPYYLTMYSEKKDRYMMNAGCICEQLSLYMLTLGLGSCFLGSVSYKKDARTRGDMEFVIVIAFGKVNGPLTRRAAEAKRLSMQELCSIREEPKHWTQSILEVARLAPSAYNAQPWRFVATGSRIHFFSKKKDFTHPGKWDEFDFGCLFAHVLIAADELWLDVDLIRLENISQKNFKMSQYVLSAIIKVE